MFRTMQGVGSLRAWPCLMTNATVQPRRPVSVWIVAVIMALNGVGAVMATMYAMGTGAPNAVLALNFLFGLLVVAVAVGLYALKSWAWSATIILQVVTLVSALFAWLSDSAMWAAAAVDIAVSLLIIGLMVRPTVRMAFGGRLDVAPRPPQ